MRDDERLQRVGRKLGRDYDYDHVNGGVGREKEVKKIGWAE